MRGWRGFVGGALVLAALQVTVASKQGPGRVGGFLTGLGDLARKFLSPTVPAFAPRSSSSSSQPGGGIGPDGTWVPNNPNKGQFGGGGASGSFAPTNYPNPSQTPLQTQPGDRVVSA